MRAKLDALRTPIVEQRVRRIGGQGFCFIPFRFLRDGFLSALKRDELALYVLLVLAANRYGVSFYGYDAICTALHMHLDQYIAARNGLIAKDLIAFDGHRYQVLSLPAPPRRQQAKPLRTADDFERDDPATIRQILRHDLDGRPPRQDDP
jgi:hypothetical protein